MTTIRFTVPGTPIGKGRPRIVRIAWTDRWWEKK